MEDETTSLLSLLLSQPGQKTALLCWNGRDTRTVNHQWLRQASKRLAQHLLPLLHDNGVLGLCFGATTMETIVAMFAALRLHLPFLLLDTMQPALEQTCRKAKCKVVLHDDTVVSDKLRGLERQGLKLLHVGDTVSAAPYFLDMDEDDHDNNNDDDMKSDANISILYLLQTSGSTGEPKLVKCPTAGALNRFQWQMEHFPFLLDKEVCLARTSLAFVDCIAEIFVPLLAGVPLVVTANTWSDTQDPCCWRDPAVVLAACRSLCVTRLVVTPTLLGQLLKEGPLSETASSLRYLHCSGEPLSISLARHVLNGAPHGMELVNIYGSTEVGADVTFAVITEQDLVANKSPYVSVGQALPGCSIYLLTHQNESGLWLQGKQGEVFVLGRQVAAGYVECRAGGDSTDESGKNSSETSPCAGFCWICPVPQGKNMWRVMTTCDTKQPMTWCFRTGDLARWDEDGRLHITGRRDQIVKIRGIKISLLEAEAALRSMDHNGIVTVLERTLDPATCTEAAKEMILVALVSASGTKGTCCCSLDTSQPVDHAFVCKTCETQVRSQLRLELREAAVPQRIFFCRELPRLSSGKIDRRGVKEVVTRLFSEIRKRWEGNGAIDQVENPRSHEAWVSWFKLQFEELLGERALPNDNFFELGGTSIAAIHLLSRLRLQLNALGLEPGAQRSHNESLLQSLEANATPWKLAEVVLSRWELKVDHEPTVVSSSSARLAGSTAFRVEALQEQDIEAVSRLAANAFCGREPLTATLLRHPKRASRFQAQVRRLCRELVGEGLSFVSRSIAGEEASKIVAFALASAVYHDAPPRYGSNRAARQFAARFMLPVLSTCGIDSRLPELQPADDLYSELFQRWCSWRDVVLKEGDCVQIKLSGAAETCQFGAAAVSACESAALEAARRHSFLLAFTMCTNEVTNYIAAAELGMRRRVAIQTVPFLQRKGVKHFNVTPSEQAALSDDHEVVLFDILLEGSRRLDVSDAVGEKTRLRLVNLDEDAAVAAQIDELVLTSFHYFRSDDISRELRHLRCREGWALLLEERGKLIACSIFFNHDNENVELLLLAVRAKDRGRGASRVLLDEMDALGRQRNWKCIFLRSNNALRRVYEPRGFVQANDEMSVRLSGMVEQDEDDVDRRQQAVPYESYYFFKELHS